MQRTDLKRIIRNRVAVWLGSVAVIFLLALIGSLVNAFANGDTDVNDILFVITMTVILALLPALFLAVVLGGIDVGLLVGLKDATGLSAVTKAAIPAGLVFVVAMLTLGSYSAMFILGVPPLAYFALGAVAAVVIAALVFRSHLRFARRWPAVAEQQGDV